MLDMFGCRAFYVATAALACMAICVDGGPEESDAPKPPRPAVPEYQEFYRTLANVTLDRYMDLISMPQVPSRYMHNDDDHPNVS